ncbi:MAG TPA: uracil-DNA glycosylase family protein [Spirochaetota bacterium]|nr:uracil-DNA glycosylase family protein [Spirochaetota bacterium]HPC42124.1 uracil-DNA glycosylase family protein [Spirochaetota bacterium]HPL19149.1 uracil-DNA glycosylase family protein [Spirochaetota bacterium]HQF10553.1 uracil-DNA glycosylase family protein [Spirochaetota bacterium]HQH99535.1 uracil-DNA glycosylase family protein [Spirochaetota bacterium]
MDARDIYRDLSRIVKKSRYRDRTLLYRGEEELDRLSGWVCRAERAVDEVHSDDLKRLVESCNRCAGVEERKFGIGTGANRVMIILNSPSLVNVVEKKILKKDSVELLKKIIQAAHLSFNECYITNLVKCDISDSLMKPSQIVKNCEDIINREIKIMKPRIAVVFGDIIPLQKTIKDSVDITWFNIEHPITLLKNPDLKRPAWNTLKLIMEKMKELNLQ